MTLSNFGAVLPRPGEGPAPGASAGPAGSPLLSARGLRPAAQQAGPPIGSPRLSPRTVQAPPPPDTRSGVVYERDGFELFYGLGGEAAGAGVSAQGSAPAARPAKQKLDGYDKFYGIRSHDKLSSSARASDSGDRLSASARVAVNAAAGPQGAEGRHAQVPSWQQVNAKAGYPGARAENNLASSGSSRNFRGAPPPKINAPPIGAAADYVPTFSVSTPVPSYVPPIECEVPSGVDVFSVATPSVPPPPGRLLVPPLKM